MRYTIIGTAGHVDHGKTQLIKALTGIDTDKLKEEKKRGITIDLGFAYFDLADGGRVGIIDVPGHEKFIRNMLAGAGGIEIALLVVAADEGFMPQTREHLGILTLLGIKQGIIVVTKTDLVDDELLDLLLLEIAGEVAGTFLENAPVVAVSAKTGQGLPQLLAKLEEEIKALPQAESHQSFRVPVDRVFTVDGFGTVITGTLMEGKLQVGDDIEIYPGGQMTKARNIQVHGVDVHTAFPGQRAAVNLAGIKHNGIERGAVLSKPGRLQPTRLIDAKVNLLENGGWQVKNNSTLHFHHGSRCVLCKITLMDRDNLSPGESCYAQLRLAEEVVIKQGDRFVLRFYSPVETVGGGIILDVAEKKHKRNNPTTIDGFLEKDTDNLSGKILQMVLERCPAFPTITSLMDFSKRQEKDVLETVDALLRKGLLLKLQPNSLAHPAYLEKLGGRAEKILAEYHLAEPLQAGMSRAIFRVRLLPTQSPAVVDQLLDYLQKTGQIRFPEKQLVAAASFQRTASDNHRKIADALLDIYEKAGLSPPSTDEVLAQFAKEKKQCKQAMDALIKEGELVLLTPQMILHKNTFNQAFAVIEALSAQEEGFTLAQFRDGLNTSRKYALAILEYCDKKGKTKKNGDLRQLV